MIYTIFSKYQESMSGLKVLQTLHMLSESFSM